MQTITVDMTPGFRQPTIHYSQNDVGTTFAIDLRSRFGDTLPASPTVKIQATKPSGFGFSIEADSVVDSVATFTTVATMTDEAGRFLAELEVSDSGVVLYTANFYMEGEANPHPIGTTDGSQETVIPTLTLLVERVEAAASSVLDMTVNATTLAAGSPATYSYDEATNTATFGIPKGADGSLASQVLAADYSSSKTYAVGDYVYYNGNLYRCSTAITTAEAWTSGHWTQVALGDDVSDLKSDINKNNADIHSPKNEIQAIQYSVYKVVDGKLIRYSNPSGFWKTMIAPIDCIYIDGVATLKTGGLSGVEAQDIPSMAFIDENWNVLSAIYTTIAPPHTFSIDDVPAGSAYVVGQLGDNFTFAFQSTDNRISIISNSVDSIESEVAEIKTATTTDATTDVALTFESATGFYNKSGGFDTYDGVTKAVVNVSEGEKYRLTAQNYYNAAVGVYLDGSNNYVSSLWYANNESAVTNKEVIVPSGVSKLMIQRFYNYTPIGLKKVVGLAALPVKSVLSEKKISVIGDSITEKNFRAKTNWVLWLTDWCGATFQNLGRSGTGFRAGYNQSKNYYPRIASIQANPDVIGVAVSFNDISNPDVELGTINDTTANDTVAGYANDFFDALITAFPTTPIICYVQNPWWAFHYGIARSDAWIELMAEICATRGIPFYSDLYRGCTLKPWLLASRQEYFTSDDTDGGSSGVVDDTHPNSEGHKVIARYLYPKFAENLVTTGLNYK